MKLVNHGIVRFPGVGGTGNSLIEAIDNCLNSLELEIEEIMTTEEQISCRTEPSVQEIYGNIKGLSYFVSIGEE